MFEWVCVWWIEFGIFGVLGDSLLSRGFIVVYIYEMEEKESKMTMSKKEAMKLAIVGNGIASRTVLSLIMKELRSSQSNALQDQLHSLHIFDKSADVQDSPHLYTGLWSASTHLLKRRVGISLDTIQNLGCAVKESGYRDHKGRWLLKPEVGMLPFPGNLIRSSH